MDTIRAFRGLTIGQKLAASSAAIGALVLALSFSSWYAIDNFGGLLGTAGNAAKKMDLVAGIDSGFLDMEKHAKHTQLAHAIETLERGKGAQAGACSSCHSVSSVEDDRREFQAAGAKVRQNIAEVRPLLITAGGREDLAAIEAGLDKWMALYQEYLGKAGSDFSAAHDIITDKMFPILRDSEKAAASLVDRQRKSLDESRGQAGATAARHRWIAMCLLGVAALVLSGVGFALIQCGRGLRGLAAELGHQAVQVASAAETVSSAGQALAEGATEQAGSLEQVSGSSAGISTTANQNAASAKTSAEVSGELSRDLNDANARLQQLLSAMQEIQSSSAKISKIVKAIDEIAFQTNILALNAAVEAARAGESGLGFAVVADEVRTLAQRSAQAAKETAGLIEESITASHNGMAKLNGVSASFQSLTRGADTVIRLSGEVRQGSLDQAQSVESIHATIEHIRQLTERATAGATDSARSGEELSRQADTLKELVGRLLHIVGAS